MHLWDAGRTETPLFISIHTDDGEHPIQAVLAGCWPHPRGLIFAETGWPGATMPAWHIITGHVSPDDGPPWTIGPATITLLDHGDPGTANWNAWIAYRQSPEGQWATPARALALMRADGQFR